MTSRFIIGLVFLFLSIYAPAQKITYGGFHNEDDRDVRFEILGKVGPNYLVYKNLRSWKHVLQVFDNEMNDLSNKKLDFISEKTHNIDFIPYANTVQIIYQFQRNGIVYCNAATIDHTGKKLYGPVTLDTTRLGYLNSNEVYYTTFSEDKSKILVYKVQPKNARLTVMTKLYDSNLQLLDSTRRVFPYNERKELYTDYQVDNDGQIIYALETKGGYRENINNVEVFTKAIGDSFRRIVLPINNFYIDELKIKIDNLNKTYLLNSFYYIEKIGNIHGLLAGVLKKEDRSVRLMLNPFSDSLRSIINPGEYRFAFNDFFLKNIFVKRDGSYIIVAENFTTQNRGMGNLWNRWDYLYNNAYMPGAYYYGNSNYYYPYRFSNFGRNTTRFVYENILVASMDSSLEMKWNNVINKSQSEDDRDGFLSYGTINTGNEIHFLFLERERNTQIVSNHSINAQGQVLRYPTLKSREAGYEFMPRLSKQVGVRQVIMPCVYRGYLVFAKVEF